MTSTASNTFIEEEDIGDIENEMIKQTTMTSSILMHKTVQEQSVAAGNKNSLAAVKAKLSEITYGKQATCELNYHEFTRDLSRGPLGGLNTNAAVLPESSSGHKMVSGIRPPTTRNQLQSQAQASKFTSTLLKE